MKEHPFAIGQVIKEAWELTKAHLGFLIGFQLIIFGIMALFGGLDPEGKWVLWQMLGWVVLILVKMGLYNSSLLITGGIQPGFNQLYQNWRMLISWVIASFLFGLMFMIGFALLIVPGLYIWARYGFFPFFILDKDVGPIEALKMSAKATEGIRWQVFLLFISCLGLDILGALFFGVGLLFTIPITLLAIAIVYRRITGTAQAEEQLIEDRK